MCLIAGKILEIDDLANMARMLAMYVITVLLGLMVHALISLPMLFFFCTRKNPFTYMRGLLQAWVTALGTASRFPRFFFLQYLLEEIYKLFATINCLDLVNFYLFFYIN